jgi:TPR repeat protein
MIGALYRAGRGVEKDPAQALAWFGKAADQGEPGGQFGLGVMHQTGDGVKQDNAAAASWYRKAADQGFGRAQNYLGVLYKDGLGVRQNIVQAYVWFALAAASPPTPWGNASQTAAGNRDAVAAKMTSWQLDDAQRMVREWKAK